MELTDLIDLIYATTNPAKLASMAGMLSPLGIVLNGLPQGVDFPAIAENGQCPRENALLKAMVYYSILRKPLFSCDSGLYIEGLPPGSQPGVHVRRVDGRSLDDKEMIAHYSSLAAGLGGRARAHYQNAVCLVTEGGRVHRHDGPELAGKAFWLVDKPHDRRVPGFPLDSLSVHIASGKYYYDLAEEAVEDGAMAEGFRQFFREALAAKERYYIHSFFSLQ